MVKFLKVMFCTVFFAAVFLPSLGLFGIVDGWTLVRGYEPVAEVPPLTLGTYTNRQFQTAATDRFSKRFFLRRTLFKTAMQLHDWMNGGLFHYGNGGGILNGRKGVLYERVYAQYHLESDRRFDPKKYDAVLAVIREFDAYCRTNGADFAYVLMPDKLQLYPEFLPPWFDAFLNYSNYDVQRNVAELCESNGVKTFNAVPFLLAEKARTDKWLYPPGGAHLNAYASGVLGEAIVRSLNDRGRSRLAVNPFRGVRDVAEPWGVDDDISLLLNTWRNSHLRDNVHYAPVFDATNVVMNSGGAVILGDCFREQVVKIFRESGLFAPEKVVQAKRSDQVASDYRNVAGDLRLVLMVYQSFNSDRLDTRLDEIKGVFSALKEARLKYASPGACR